jgi:hypothetical protein
MSFHLLPFLIGLFVVPLGLLWLGHRLRRRSVRAHRAFWGGVIGYCVSGPLAVVWGMIPPESWESGETVRGFVGLWSMLIFPLLGAVVAMLTASDAARD